MIDAIEIACRGPIRAAVRPPGSKSITNRALMCAALATGRSTLAGALDCDDTRMMIGGLRALGIAVEEQWSQSALVVDGCAGRPPADSADLFVGNSGTSMRFLTPLAALGQGRFRLDGVERMRNRPIEDLLDALRQLGICALSERGTNCPPVVVTSRGLSGGKATVRGSISSQFLSGLLMAAPCAAGDIEVSVDGMLVSQPYVRMTLAVMESFGVAVETGPDLSSFHIAAPRPYRATVYEIEPDASAASYFFAAAAITGGQIEVQGLSRDSLQGDVGFVDVLEQMGCEVRHGANRIVVRGCPLRGIEVDMNAISDTVQTLAAVALFAEGATTITGVAHIRHKETDRVRALVNELRKLGAEVEERPNGLRIVPHALQGARIHTYEDHRMAMSMALVGLKTPGVVICDPDCTAKTFPNFFSELAALA